MTDNTTMTRPRTGADGGGSALPALRLSETILRTGRMAEMREWYRTVLGVEPSLENKPEGPETFEDGTARASSMQLCFFELNEDYPYTQTLGIFGVPGIALAASDETPGLHHLQLHAGTIEALVSRFEALSARGIRPARTMNHGPGISFYYADPDGNKVEFTANNYATLDEYRAFLASEAFHRNISGVMIDPDEFRRRFRAGEPIETLREF